MSSLLVECESSVPEFIDPRFPENKPKTLVFSHTKRAFWVCFRENRVYNFRHWTSVVVAGCERKPWARIFKLLRSPGNAYVAWLAGTTTRPHRSLKMSSTVHDPLVGIGSRPPPPTPTSPVTVSLLSLKIPLYLNSWTNISRRRVFFIFLLPTTILPS